MRSRRSSLDSSGLGLKLAIGVGVLLLAALIGLLIYAAGIEPVTQTYEQTLPDAGFPQ